MQRSPISFVLVLGVSFVASSISLADEPVGVSLDEIRQLRWQGTLHEDIIQAIEERGLDFELNPSMERALRRMGFRRKSIARLKTLDSKEHRETDPGTEDELKRFAERIKKVKEASGTDAAMVSAGHITLICKPALAKRILRDVKQLEQMLAKRFPAPLGRGPDKRNANIALFPTRYEYEAWIRALFKVYEEEGMRFEEWDVLERAIKTDRFLMKGIFNCCMEKMTPREARHAVAYAVGYHYFERGTDGKAPVALTTGFGNVTEVMLLGNPTMMLNSGYAERNLGGGANPWAITVRQRFAQGAAPSVADLLNYKTRVMQFPQYADCWSFATFLASGAERFSSLVSALRGDEQALDAIRRIYELDAKPLHLRWRKYAMRGR